MLFGCRISWASALWLALAGFVSAQDCAQPVCQVSHNSLKLTQVITFDDVASGFGPGRAIDEVLIRPGARFGERFAGQIRAAEGDFDRISGPPRLPLRVIDGGAGLTLSAMRLTGSNVLMGLGPRGFPKISAVGEGAIAVLFDHDQPALSIDIRGGEEGFVTLVFLRRDGSTISHLNIGPVGEETYGFVRFGQAPDIAGFLVLNSDPEGIAIDNLRFEALDLLG